jgi:hypothetical protein
LSDLFKENDAYKLRLTSIVKKQISERAKDQDTMFYPDANPEINEDSNFYISKDALVLYFHPYEIAAYAAGFPEFTIKFNEIIDIINTDGEFWNTFEKEINSL